MRKVTVLMPVYNAEKYLTQAIESILNQTYNDFEFLIINDGSTDRSAAIIKSYTDSRIRFIENETNLRLIATLNKGIELARGDYIVRMDADDVCLPQRLERQVSFMDAHPDVGLCGSFLRTLGLKNDYDISFETGHDAIKFKLFFDTHFPHPAAIIRKSVLLQHHLRFEKDYIHAEDFELWNRMAGVCRLAVIPEVLVLKRVHDEQISAMHVQTQEKISRKIRTELIQKLGLSPSVQEMDVYEQMLKNVTPRDRSHLDLLLGFLEKLVQANRSSGIYRYDLFEGFFGEKFWQLCTRSTHLGLWIFSRYRKSFLRKEKINGSKPAFRFFLKALMKYDYSAIA